MEVIQTIKLSLYVTIVVVTMFWMIHFTGFFKCPLHKKGDRLLFLTEKSVKYKREKDPHYLL